MKKRGRGRPRLETPRSRQLNIRMFPETRKRLEKLAGWSQLSMADYIKRLIDNAWRRR